MVKNKKKHSILKKMASDEVYDGKYVPIFSKIYKKYWKSQNKLNTLK